MYYLIQMVWLMFAMLDRYNFKELSHVALEKLRADRNIIKEYGFRKRMKKAENRDLLVDLFKRCRNGGCAAADL